MKIVSKMKRFVLGLSLSLLFLTSCSDDDVAPGVPLGTEGFFVVNEGAYGNGNASISFYDRSEGTMTNDFYLSANEVPLGDQAQSMAIHDDKGYIVVQNSSKVEVVGMEDFETIATISEGIESPRYFIGVSESKGYVSDWGADGVSGTVRVIDLDNNKVSATINTGRKGPNQMLLVGEELFVVNNGGWGSDSTITVINTVTDVVTKTITVSDNPNSLKQDAQGNIWVACSGQKVYDYETYQIIEDESSAATIAQLSVDGTVLQALEASAIAPSAGHLNINAAGTMLYYLWGGQIYEMSTSAAALPATPFASEYYYGLSVDPSDDSVIGCAAPGFDVSGNIDIYPAEGGSVSATFSVGIGSNSCVFL